MRKIGNLLAHAQNNVFSDQLRLSLRFGIPVEQRTDWAAVRVDQPQLVAGDHPAAVLVPGVATWGDLGTNMPLTAREQAIVGIVPVMVLQPSAENQQANYGAQVQRR
jgi:hypothetical protein